MRFKQTVCNIIRDDGHRSVANRIFSNGIMALIVLNIGTVVLDLLYLIPEGREYIFDAFETVTVVVFTVEYLLRLWTADLMHPKISAAVARLRYVRSPMAVVDVLAVVPFYLPFLPLPANMTFLRMLRLLRLARIMKLNRYSDSKTSEIVMASIQEAFVLLDSECNFLAANNTSRNVFPSIKNIKKYSHISKVGNWPMELVFTDEQSVKKSVRFDMEDKHYRANISTIYDREKLLRYVILVQDITESIKLFNARQEREQSELRMASNIQASLLPNRFPAFPGRDEFDIFALMNPAKEVGGDFYDFFFINEDKLAVVVADVSGKGMPAALFMVNAKTQLKNIASRQDASIAEVMTAVNDLLCEGNDECLFVTIFFGVLEVSTGRFNYVNAGHDVPLIKRGNEFDWLPTRAGFMAGFMEGSGYEIDETILQKDDILFMYTDGVNEAENPSKEQFSTERIKTLLNECKLDSPKEIIDHIRKEIDVFEDGAEQFDDITMLSLKVTK